jgi:small subunit ribosomal protein S17
MTSKSKVEEEGEEKPKAKKKTVKKVKASTKTEGEEKVTAAPLVPKKDRGTRDIGVDVTPPPRSCTDVDCPFHGKLSVRGIILEGEVVSDRMDKGAVVRRERLRYVPKYERYEKIASRYAAHNPPCIAAKKGDKVTIMECRPLSKTISFVIIERKEGI